MPCPPAALCFALVWACVTSCSREQRTPLLVLAASSLTDAFQELERDHEQQQPGVDVQLSFAGSSVLALQLEQGGAGDVLATASEEHMRRLVASRAIGEHAVFAHNQLVVAVPPSNPADLQRFEDLAKVPRVVLGTRDVPAGKYADALIERARATLGDAFGDGVTSHIVSREANVRLVLAKVALGEADAAIVYQSDIKEGRAKVIEVPEALRERATYPIGIPTRAKQPELARAFMAHVLSDEGQAVLAKHRLIPARAPAPAAAK
jgi:molybdate transport system substrate-binding protein